MSDQIVIHVIDDDAAMRESLAFLLDVNGFKSHVYESAAAFLEGTSADAVSCVVSDVRMPGMDGNLGNLNRRANRERWVETAS